MRLRVPEYLPREKTSDGPAVRLTAQTRGTGSQRRLAAQTLFIAKRCHPARGMSAPRPLRPR
eukprot:1928011-Heterocapsa_arctica.AAC.1